MNFNERFVLRFHYWWHVELKSRSKAMRENVSDRDTELRHESRPARDMELFRNWFTLPTSASTGLMCSVF
jgi:hypothetical protein